MKKPKVFIDPKDGQITIIFPKEYDRSQCNVTLVHDRGVAITKETNFFGNPISRFVYHGANAYGDSGYCTELNSWDTSEEVEHKLVPKPKGGRNK